MENIAPGGPGIPARWTSSAKSGIGCALNASCNVNFTLSHGIVNEIYYPREDLACTRDMGLIVTDGQQFFSEEKRHAHHETRMMEEGVPGYQLINTSHHQRYRIEKEVITDPLRDTFLQRIKFRPLQGELNKYQLYVLLAPHLGNRGGENTAWIGDYKGVPMLFAERDRVALAMACSSPWKKCSVGFVGISDGWRDLKQHKHMCWEYQRAENGNVALTAQLDLEHADGQCTVAVGFGRNTREAGHRAWASIMDGFDHVKKQYVQEWQEWQKSLSYLKSPGNTFGRLFRISAAVLRIHEAKRFPGGIIASLSIPWGFSKGDDDIGGYHLVWPRDLVEASGGLIALEAKEDALRVLNYLMVTQEADGHWSQNMWLEGDPHWQGIQMDQVSLPILLIDLCRQHDILKPETLHRYWKTVKKAVSYMIRFGPFTRQDRWEEEAGWLPSTMAVEIAALLAAADFAEENGEPELAQYCRETADVWNAGIERWTYVSGTSLAQEVGVEGYYIRVNPSGVDARDLRETYIRVKNRPEDKSQILASELVSTDALALVRFGLRAPDDPRILNTIKVIDAKLKVATPSGPCWHRYNEDGYGEHADGSPYNGTGIGRVWPLLTGERAHYEIAAGNLDQAKKLMNTMESFANHGLFPEQVWDAEDMPEKELYFGKHTGSAMPLVWAHAEYIKLCCSLKMKKVFDMPGHAQQRYLRQQTEAAHMVWRFDWPCHHVPGGKILRIETMAAAQIHWSTDHWHTTADTPTFDTGVGVHVADLDLQHARSKDVFFTFYWVDTGHWENKDFCVRIE